MKSSHFQGYLFVSLASLILGSNGIFARFVDLPSPVLLFYRFLFGTLILSLTFLIKKRELPFPQTNKKEIVLFGFINTLLAVLAFYAFTNTSIANAEILLYSFPIYIIIFAPIVLKEKIEKATVINLLIAFAGLILIAFSGGITSLNQNALGIISGFAAGIVFAIFVLLAKIIRTKYEGLELNLYQMTVSVLLLLPGLFIFQYQIDTYKIILLIVMGLLHSALALSLYFIGIKTVKAQHVGIISYFEPLSAVVYAFIFLAEIPSIYTFLGGGLILYSGYKIFMTQK